MGVCFQVFNKRLFSIYRIANPPFGTDVARDLELVYMPGTHESIYESWDARYGQTNVWDIKSCLKA